MNRPQILKVAVGAFAVLALASAGDAATYTLLTSASDSVLAIQLQGSTIAVATQIASGGPGITGNKFPVGEAPLYTIDGSSSTKYLNFGITNTGILIDPANDLLPLDALQLTTANDSSSRDPVSFSIYGTNNSLSTDLADYTPIVLNQLIAMPTARKTASEMVTFLNTTAFDSYLVIFPTIRDASASDAVAMQVAEIGLYSTVPEPSTWAMLLGGAGVCGWRMRRKHA